MSRYHEVYQAWQRDPETFWAEAAAEIDWDKPWDKVFDVVDGLDRWFVGCHVQHLLQLHRPSYRSWQGRAGCVDL